MPELASRNHLVTLRPLIRAALDASSEDLAALDDLVPLAVLALLILLGYLS